MPYNNQKNYIFIVGNGFDLNLDLKSNFYDFIVNKYFNKNEKLIIDLYKRYLGEKDLFEFLIYFLFQDDKHFIDYKDILDLMHKKFFIFLYLHWNFNNFKNQNIKDLENLKNVKWSDVETTLVSILSAYYNGWWLNFHGILDIVSNKNSSLSFGYYHIDGITNIKKLLINNKRELKLIIEKSLRQFENEFNNYLLSITNEDNFINKLSTQWAAYIYRFIDRKPFVTNNIYCLSFNYTTCNSNEIINKIKQAFSKNKILYNEQLIKYINIHGHVQKMHNDESSSIVIGIDDTKNSDNHLFYEFSKSYKVAKIRANNENNNSLRFHNDLNNVDIYFYGHSLSKNDYSYFQAIFDRIDLYSNNVILHFVYPSDENDINHSKLCNFSNIYELVHEYGNSFNNKDKGKNLFSKLLIEDRLKIHFIKWSELLKQI